MNLKQPQLIGMHQSVPLPVLGGWGCSRRVLAVVPLSSSFDPALVPATSFQPQIIDSFVCVHFPTPTRWKDLSGKWRQTLTRTYTDTRTSTCKHTGRCRAKHGGTETHPHMRSYTDSKSHAHGYYGQLVQEFVVHLRQVRDWMGLFDFSNLALYCWDDQIHKRCQALRVFPWLILGTKIANMWLELPVLRHHVIESKSACWCAIYNIILKGYLVRIEHRIYELNSETAQPKKKKNDTFK